jgi:uncharacterized protein YjbI with pentapeptide repeats
MSRRTQKQLVEHRLADIRNNKARRGFKWGFSDKTGWDWLDLMAKLAIPLILGIATLLFSIQQAHLADLQHQSDQKLAQQQHEADQQSTLDQERQATLVTYLNNMRDLLLNRGLLTSKPNDEIRVIARTETLSAMRQLDGKRNSILVEFLQEASLIGADFTTGEEKDHNIVSFDQADMSSIDLSGTGLIFADLSNAYLKSTNLSNASLSGANLYQAYLGGTNLSGAILSSTNLRGAYLESANLRGAYLDNADLSFATNLTQQQLDQVYTCQGATLPPGLTCHQAPPINLPTPVPPSK